MRKLLVTGAAAVLAMALTGPVLAEDQAKTIEGVLTLYEGQKFDRRNYRVDKDAPRMAHDFLVGSIAVYPGEVWEVCDKPKFQGNCIVVTEDQEGIGRAVIVSIRAIKVAK